MITLVAAFLGLADIILNADHFQIILPCDHICYKIDFWEKRTGNADSCNIIDILDHILNIQIMSIFPQLFHNAFRCLQAALHILNRIVWVHMVQFAVQHLNPASHLRQRWLIDKHGCLEPISVRAFSYVFLNTHFYCHTMISPLILFSFSYRLTILYYIICYLLFLSFFVS